MPAETYATLLAAGQRQSFAFAPGWSALQVDPFRIMNAPQFRNAGSINGSNTQTIRWRRIGVNGRNRMQPRGDGASGTTTAFDNAYADVTINPFFLGRSATDLAQITDSAGQFSPSLLMMDAWASREGALVDLVANLLDTFRTPLGTSGVKMSLATFLAGKQACELVNNEGPLMFIGHTKGVTDLQIDLSTASGGAIQWLDQTGALIGQGLKAYKGRFLDVDIAQTTRAPTMNAGVDYAGAFLAPDAVLIGNGVHPMNWPDRQLYIGDVLMDGSRNVLSGEDIYGFHVSLGAVELDDLAGQTVQFKAA